MLSESAFQSGKHSVGLYAHEQHGSELLTFGQYLVCFSLADPLNDAQCLLRRESHRLYRVIACFRELLRIGCGYPSFLVYSAAAARTQDMVGLY
jgi:hypothetical protein